MTDKIKCWRSEDRQWFCILVNDGISQATVSLTPDELVSAITASGLGWELIQKSELDELRFDLAAAQKNLAAMDGVESDLAMADIALAVERNKNAGQTYKEHRAQLNEQLEREREIAAFRDGGRVND